MTNADVVQLITQGGSFGVIVIGVIYAGRVLVPMVVRAFERQGEEFAKSLDKVMDRHERDNTRRDAAFEKLADAVDKMADRIERLEDRTGEHGPLG